MCSALREAEEIFGDGFEFDKIQEELEEDFDEDDDDEVMSRGVGETLVGSGRNIGEKSQCDSKNKMTRKL